MSSGITYTPICMYIHTLWIYIYIYIHIYLISTCIQTLLQHLGSGMSQFSNFQIYVYIYIYIYIGLGLGIDHRVTISQLAHIYLFYGQFLNIMFAFAA